MRTLAVVSRQQKSQRFGAPRPPRKFEEKPSLSFRVHHSVLGEIEHLRPLFPTADGEPADRSDLLRAMVRRVMDSARAIAANRRIEASAAWRLVFAALDRLAAQAPAEGGQEGNQEGETSP